MRPAGSKGVGESPRLRNLHGKCKCKAAKDTIPDMTGAEHGDWIAGDYRRRTAWAKEEHVGNEKGYAGQTTGSRRWKETRDIGTGFWTTTSIILGAIDNIYSAV